MFCIAEFPGVGQNKEIAIAHRNWIHGNFCYWPHFWKSSSRMNNALTQGEMPDPQKWLKYEIRIVGNRYFGTYDEARKQLTSAEFHSDFSSEENLERLRARPKAAENTDSDSDSSLLSVSGPFETPKSRHARKKSKRSHTVVVPKPPEIPSNVSPLPAPSHKLVAVADIQESRPAENTEPNSGVQSATIGPTSAVSSSPSSLDGRLSSNEIPRTLTRPSEYPSAPIMRNSAGLPFSSSTFSTSHYSALPSSICSSNGTPTSYVPFGGSAFQRTASGPLASHSEQPPGLLDMLKSLQTNQELLLAKADIQIDLMRTLLQMKEANKNADLPVGSLSLPFTEISQFRSFEERMKSDPSLRDNLITVLGSTGGKNPNQVVYRVMAELMRDELMVQFTFKGHTGKDSFKDTTYFLCVYEAVKRQAKGAIMSKKEIEDAVDYWLRKASTRLTKAKERQEKSVRDELE